MPESSEKTERLGPPKHILLLRPGAIGDALLTFPLLRVLKEQGNILTFVSNPAVLPLATSFCLVDEAYDYGSLLWSELFSQAPIRSPVLQELLASTDRAICWLRDPDNIVRHRLMEQGVQDISIVPGRPVGQFTEHIVSYLSQTAGIMLPGHAWKDVFSPGLRADARFVAVHPGSGGEMKCWSVERFAEVMRSLWQRDVPVLLLAGPADMARVAQLSRLLGQTSASHLTTLLDAPLLEVTERLRDCRCYLGNDSGITHLAALLGLSTVALFGPSSPTLWRPVGRDVTVLAQPNIQDIEVETVVETIIASLHRHMPC